MKKSKWFSKENNKFKTVIFVEPSPNGELLKLLKETESKFPINDDERIKFIEKAGVKNISLLKVSNPFKENCLAEDNCFPCSTNDTFTDCNKSNIGYRIICKLCESRNITVTYEGESCRNMNIRGNEHMKQLKNKDKNSVLYKHIQSVHAHEENIVKFQMIKTGSFRKPLSRQIDEGLRIKNADKKNLMNSKAEFHGPSIVRKYK